MWNQGAGNGHTGYSYRTLELHNGVSMIIGIDEAGRGALAGPVVVAAVAILNPEAIKHIELNDSKKLTPTKRYKAYDQLLKAASIGAIKYSIHFVDNITIDEINILKATCYGARKATLHLLDKAGAQTYDILKKMYSEQSVTFVIDGDYDLLHTFITDRNKKLCVPKADSIYPEVMAASILAKVSRDMYMQEADLIYPGYDFAKSKGYPSPKHMQAIIDKGPCEIHRKTFKRVKEYVASNK